MSYIVTGGAGFIGSCVIRKLNDMGIEDIIVVDNIASTEKWKNLRNKKYTEYINRSEFLQRLPEFSKQVSHVIHMGACSATTERDFDYLYHNNFEYTKALWKFCVENKCSFIYASSAATYGDGTLGFDDEMNIDELLPLNGYGYSKQLFDLWIKKQSEFPKQAVGFKFFNVFGPNEYYKGSMASVIFHSYATIKKEGTIKLFKSYKEGFSDGEQKRDFVYVKDICDAIWYCIENEHVNGLFNLGTGIAHSFNELAEAIFEALGMEKKVEYIEMPKELRDRYQYFTQATMDKFHKAGYTNQFYSFKDSIYDYVVNYLEKETKTY